MKRYVVVLIGLTLAGCSVQPSGSVSPSATPAGASCRLPVLLGSPPQAGFLAIPGNVFTPATDAGTNIYFDRAVGEWVPAVPPALSPDGTHYVYLEGDRKTSWVFLADARTGTRLVLAAGGPWQLVGLNSSAAYAMRVEYVDTTAFGTIAVSRGLWRMPLEGTAATQLTSDNLRWQWVDNRAVYGAGSTLDPSGQVSPLVVYDFATGRVVERFESPGRTTVLGTDAAGGILVITEAQDEELWRIPPTPGEAVKVWSASLNAMRPAGPVALDNTGMWISSVSSSSMWAIYHYSTSGQFDRVATFTDRPVAIAGLCA